MWKLRKFLIKKLAGRQTVVLNTRIAYFGKEFKPDDLFLQVKGHHKKWIMENNHIRHNSGKMIDYNDLE